VADTERYERVLTAMWHQIHKVLRWRAPPRGSRTWREPVISGSGVSAADILSDALEALLRLDSPTAVQSWEALGITVADRRAKDALRHSQKGLRATSKRPQLKLVSGDQTIQRADESEDSADTLFDRQLESAIDGQAEFDALHDAQQLIELARQLLQPRDLRVWLAIHCGTQTKTELAGELTLTPQRVSQIYLAALAVLEAHPRYPYRDEEEGGQDGHGQ
jgi:DNA-directed RNA polymerase specialized sigma24 family protein